MVAVPHHVADDQLASISSPVDEYPLASCRSLTVRQHASNESRAAEKNQQQDRVDEKDRSWITARSERASDEQEEQDRTERNRRDQRAKVVNARLAPESFV